MDIETQINKALADILGTNAMCNSEFQVDPEVSKLALAIDYLTAQLEITAKMDDTFKRKEYVHEVFRQTHNILTGIEM